MRLDIIKGFLPWFVFFAFNDGTAVGLTAAALSGLLCLFIFNFRGLKRKFILDIASLIVLILFVLSGFIFYKTTFAQYSLFLADLILALVCFISIAIKKPFALQYAKTKVAEIYWNNPIFLGINIWLAFVWGFIFLLAAISTGLFSFGFGAKLWLMEIIPTALIVTAIFFTIIFPDSYQKKIIKSIGGVAAIPDISEVQIVSLGSMSIAYRTLGEGPLLVLIYGMWMNMHSWDVDLLKRLSQNFKLLLFDYPGVGHSNYENMPYTAENIANVLYRLINKLELKPAGIIGYSLGSWVAQEFALHYPELAPLLILLGSRISGDKSIRSTPEVQRQFKEMLLLKGDELNTKKIALNFVESAVPRMQAKMQQVDKTTQLEGAPSAEVMQQFIKLLERWYANNATVEALKELTTPTLILAGKQDIIVPVENSRLLQQYLKNSELIEYPDAGHGLLYQYPLDIADQIKTFVEKHREQ